VIARDRRGIFSGCPPVRPGRSPSPLRGWWWFSVPSTWAWRPRLYAIAPTGRNRW